VVPLSTGSSGREPAERAHESRESGDYNEVCGVFEGPEIHVAVVGRAEAVQEGDGVHRLWTNSLLDLRDAIAGAQLP